MPEEILNNSNLFWRRNRELAILNEIARGLNRHAGLEHAFIVTLAKVNEFFYLANRLDLAFVSSQRAAFSGGSSAPSTGTGALPGAHREISCQLDT